MILISCVTASLFESVRSLIRVPGETFGLHSGGHERATRCQFRYHDGRVHCGQINILMALNDIGAGDGATMVIPGSHKSNIRHPEFDDAAMATVATSVDGVTGAVEVYLEAGDALLFVDAIIHDSAARRNRGQRRIAMYRYGPSWGFFRHNYRPGKGLLDRLSQDRRQIVMPHKPPPLPPFQERVEHDRSAARPAENSWPAGKPDCKMGKAMEAD